MSEQIKLFVHNRKKSHMKGKGWPWYDVSQELESTYRSKKLFRLAKSRNRALKDFIHIRQIKNEE